MNQQAVHFDRFTGQARAAFVLAQQETMRRGQPFIEPEHLILGILCDPASMAIRTLRGLNVTPETVRAVVEKVLEEQRGGQIIEQAVARPQLSPRTQRVIELGSAERMLLQHDDFATGHLLLGLLREEEAGAFLSSLGISLEAARAELDRLCKQTPAGMQQAASAQGQPEYVRRTGAVQLDDSRQQQAIALARSRQRVRFVYMLVLAVLVAAITVFVLQSAQLLGLLSDTARALMSSPILNWQPIAGWSPLLVLLTFVLVSIPLLAISVPLSWYIGFVLPRRQGLRKGTARNWWAQLGKGLLVLSVQVWLLVEVIMLLRAVQPQAWWAWAGLIQFLYSILLARFGPTWLQPRLNRIEPLPEGELAERARALMGRLRIPPCGLYQVNVSHRTNAANAMFAGWGNGRRILLTDTMVQHFPLDEIEVILAHELAHLVHHDIWTRLLMRGLMLLGAFYLIDLYFTSLGVLMTNTFSSITLLWALSPLIGLVLLLVFARLVVRYRRHQEYQADEFALQATGKVQTFKDAMTRLTNAGMLVATSTKRARHPASHPTLLKRLRHADEFAARQGRVIMPTQV